MYHFRETVLLAVIGSPFHGAFLPIDVRVMLGEPRHWQEAHVHVVLSTGYLKYLKLNIAHVLSHVHFHGCSVVCATANICTIRGFNKKLLRLFFHWDLVSVNKVF